MRFILTNSYSRRFTDFPCGLTIRSLGSQRRVSSYPESLAKKMERNISSCPWCLPHRSYAFKSDLKIKWVRPPKIMSIKPEKSGDLEPLPPVNPTQYQVHLDKSQELQKSDDIVKKLFTLHFSYAKEAAIVQRENMIKKVQRHAHDRLSPEVHIACMTITIRKLQNHMEKFPHDKRSKVFLKELIEKRKKFLKYLRRWDYKKFEWLLEQLDIVYRPPPRKFIRVTRKESLRKLTDKYCEELRESRLKAYQQKLEAQQVEFLREKIKSLKWVQEEEKQCGVPVTVQDEDINNVVEQLKSLKLNQETKANVKSDISHAV